MAATTSAPNRGGGFLAPLSELSNHLPGLLLRLVVLMALDALAISFGWRTIQDGAASLGIAVWIILFFVNVVYLRNDMTPLRWIMPGLALMAMMHIYPVTFTVYTAFTNYGDGHLIEKPLAIRQIQAVKYLPEEGHTFTWTAFKAQDGSYALWVQDAEGNGYLATEESFLGADEVVGLGPLDADGIPESISGYERVQKKDVFKALKELEGKTFGGEEHGLQIKSLKEAAQFQQRYVYDPETDSFTDQSDGTVFRAVEGTYTSEDGRELIPGYPVTVGIKNFYRLLTNRALRGPFLSITGWTFAWAFFSVLMSFSLGLFLAIVLNDPDLPFQRLTRVLMIVPYAVPAFISVLIWKGLFNPILGVIGSQWNPGWFSDPLWAKIGVLLVNMWLGFPYMFLISTGALQGIPQDIFEAATVDGAGGFQRFWRITLPLLLISVGPLLVGSFAFNFNNFTIIDLYNGGGPPMSGTATPAGYTDIMISYTYRMAFAGGRGADYGLAAAIAVIIFLIVAAVTLFNFRYTGMLEEVSENV
ncbi:MAG: ABC transporter permease subunit [Chloroflexi bacterium]|nr:MAG: ABC transporter permease subunit [Chloroflexota bacterium]